MEPIEFDNSAKLKYEMDKSRTPEGFEITDLLSDTIMVEPCDLEDGHLNRKGILIPEAAAITKTWRLGKPVLCGDKISETSKKCFEDGKYVIFPSSRGLFNQVNFNGIKKDVIFIKEDVIFCWGHYNKNND